MSEQEKVSGLFLFGFIFTNPCKVQAVHDLQLCVFAACMHGENKQWIILGQPAIQTIEMLFPKTKLNNKGETSSQIQTKSVLSPHISVEEIN